MKKSVKKETMIQQIMHGPTSFGDRAADLLAKAAGSWTFIIIFLVFLGGWMATSGALALSYISGDLADPYPFILLNLVLSCLAALQAPVILMSQNRQAAKDRKRMEYDYGVNRRAEKGIEEILVRVKRLESKRK